MDGGESRPEDFDREARPEGSVQGARPDVRDLEAPRPCLHFVGFRGEELQSARKIWGEADFYHRVWDRRAGQELLPGDVLVHATGEADAEHRDFNASDTVLCDEQSAYDAQN